MSSFIKLTVISGAEDESHLCYLLEIDQAKILLDCGWNQTFSPQDLGKLGEIAKDVDAVLLTHADLSHMGGYPYAVSHLGLGCPCYVTVPVHDMGRGTLIDAFKSKRQHEDFTTFTSADIEMAMSKMTLLRYSQPYTLQGRCQGIVVTPFGAGHTIGGTIWKIRKDTEDIIYTVDYNHRKERHLNGSVLISTDGLSKPSLLITDAYNVMTPNAPPRKERDKELINTITSTLDVNANVLIPIESTTRVLELAYLLDQHLAFNRLSHNLVFLTHHSAKTINLARSMLEWMGDGISQAFVAVAV
jgi:cleavage and polyadenylation specificity factor subunit 2